MTDYLTVEDLLRLTRDLGIGPVSDIGLLDSAAHRPTTSLYGHEAYPTIDKKAAVLLGVGRGEPSARRREQRGSGGSRWSSSTD